MDTRMSYPSSGADLTHYGFAKEGRKLVETVMARKDGVMTLGTTGRTFATIAEAQAAIEARNMPLAAAAREALG